MSSIERSLSGEVLVVELRNEAGAVPPGGRAARTLVKNGALRVTLVTVAPGGGISEHHADGPITVQPLEGRLRFTAAGTVHDIGPGQLLSLEAGLKHSIASTSGTTFLLTVAKGDESVSRPAPVHIVGVGQPLPSAGSGTDAWLEGPVEGVPPLLMSAAHALVRAVEDVRRAVADLLPEELWARPGGAGSVGFHLRHIAGSTERLVTHARGMALTPDQRSAIDLEGTPGTPPAPTEELVTVVGLVVERALAVLRLTSAEQLLEFRGVGRAQRPSNVLGLLAHAAEHAQRHSGQVITTAKILRGTVPVSR